MTKLLTRAEVAVALRRTPDHVTRMVREGRFPKASIGAGRAGGLWRETTVEAWINNGGTLPSLEERRATAS